MRRFVLSAGVFVGLSYFLWWGNSNVSLQPDYPVNGDDLEEFVAKVKERMVFVEGGRFFMGDYGREYGEEGVSLDSKSHSKPMHEVLLSDFYMDKYKVTNQDFWLYLRHGNAEARVDVSGSFNLFNSHPRLPARMDWFEAEKYCAWLANISGLPFSLATEAQWEYAARSRGKFLMVSTSDGSYNYQKSASGEIIGVNISSSLDRENFSNEQGWDAGGLSLLPVDQFPPNSLGIYSMSDNGREWVKDWYDPTYYEYSPLKNPQGPEQAVHQDPWGRPTKVMRGQPLADENWTIGVNVYRTPVNPHAYFADSQVVILASTTARCVINTQ